WIDWQQGKKSDVDGLDPLCALNHYHFLDNAENGELPLILSRYCGYGSHRYPLGFSGDTAISWRVLDFQPYFTINAANCAYTWWSHDIGGHHMGYRDDELYLRWIEFGVFSPVLRLHSTSSMLLGKEPWKYRKDICESAKQWLCFRHRLIPYIYTMDYRNHKNGIALCEPMYYSYPNTEEAFNVANQYMFGSELMICPITSKASTKTNFGTVKAWIPEGKYTDIFTMQSYTGPKEIELSREIYSIPVLAKEGAILPLSNDKGNTCGNPEQLEIWVFNGNNSFTLYEDNGKTNYEECNVKTEFEITSDHQNTRFVIKAPVGDTELIPGSRKYRIVFKDIVSDDIDVPEGADIYQDKTGAVIVECDFKTSDIAITIKNTKPLPKDTYQDRIINIFSRWQEGTAKKNNAYKAFKNETDKDVLSSILTKSHLPKDIKVLVRECLNEE
ncbi:MAG TPA: alpha-xylosidase, partial [Ruminococcaceae bacterium]|nr:alpha-xylosidase [Oscillospiraceae bacterium]